MLPSSFSRLVVRLALAGLSVAPALAASPAPAPAPASVTPAAPLTLAQALALTSANHPQLAARAYESRAAAGLMEQAAQAPAPTLDVAVENVLGTGRLRAGHSLEATVQASRTWERGDKREKRVALASRTRDTADRDLAVLEADLLAATAAAYAAAVAAKHRVALAAEPVRLAREIVAAVERRVQAGAASAAESARARAALALAQADLTRSASAASAALAALAAALGTAPPAPLALPVLPTDAAGSSAAPRGTDSSSPPDESVLRARLAAHPRLARHAAVIAAHRAALALEQTQTVADVTASGGLRFLRDGSDAGFVAGLSVPLPGRTRNAGALRAAREALAGAEAAARAAEADLLAQFSAATLDLSAARTLALALRRDAMPPAAEALAAVRRGFEAGQLPLLDVLDAQRALAAVRREVADADTAVLAALVRVEALADRTFPATSALLAAR